MTTRGEWATQLLHALGNDTPSSSTVNFVASWTLAENTRAAFNPLATTQPMDGSSCFNSVCVRNYRDNGQGIEATVKTLKNGHYPHILEGLRTNEPEKAANGYELGVWGTGLHGVALWRVGDHRNENLLSHRAADTSQTQPSTQSGPVSAQIPADSPASQIGVMNVSDSDKFAQSVKYMALGGMLLIIAVVLAIRTYVPTGQIVRTIAAAA